jgi:hypothetical protein
MEKEPLMTAMSFCGSFFDSLHGSKNSSAYTGTIQKQEC